MKPLTKKYLIFFLIAYLIFRLPSLFSPIASRYILKQFISAADSSGFIISIQDLENDGLSTITGNKVKIYKKDAPHLQYYLVRISNRLKSFFPPSMEIESSLYQGNLSCTIKSDGIISLIKDKSAKLFCDLTQLNLESFPDTLKFNILGILDSSLEADLHKNVNLISSTAEIRLTNGYLDFSKLIGSNLIQIPAIEEGDLFASIQKDTDKIHLKEIAFKSNFGFVKGSGNIISDIANKKISLIDISGTFDLTSIGETNLAPWLGLINNGQTLKSKTGSFKISGAPNSLKFKID